MQYINDRILFKLSKSTTVLEAILKIADSVLENKALPISNNSVQINLYCS